MRMCECGFSATARCALISMTSGLIKAMIRSGPHFLSDSRARDLIPRLHWLWAELCNKDEWEEEGDIFVFA